MNTGFNDMDWAGEQPSFADDLDAIDAADEIDDDFADYSDFGGEELAVDLGDEATWGDEFAEGDAADAIEELMVDALEAEDADELLGGLIGGLGSIGKLAGGIGKFGGGIGKLAGAAGRAGRVVGRLGGAARRAQGVVGRVGQLSRRAQGIAGRVGRVTRKAQSLNRRINRLSRQGRRLFGSRDTTPDLPDDPQRQDDRTNQQASQLPEPYASMMQQLAHYQNQGFDELEALEDLADGIAEADFSDDEMDEALPIVAGIAANAIARPLLRHGAQQLTRRGGRQLTATSAARKLVRRHGAHGLRALPGIAHGVQRSAIRRRASVRALAPMLQRAAHHVSASPDLTWRLAQGSRTAMSSAMTVRRKNFPGRPVVPGPIEITIL
jgi:hypothetical protein